MGGGALEQQSIILHARGHNQAAIVHQRAVVPCVGFLLQGDRPCVIKVQATVDEEVHDPPAVHVDLALLVRKLRHDHSHEVLGLGHARRA